MPNHLNPRKLFSLIILLLCFSKVFSQTNKKDTFIPFDSVVNYLEQKYAIDLYYKSEWFKNKRFHSTIVDLPLGEIISLIKNAGNCSDRKSTRLNSSHANISYA